MKRCRLILLCTLFAGASGTVFAHSGGYGHHGHHHGRSRTHVGVVISPSIGWSWHYPGAYAYPTYAYPPYYYPYSAPVVVVPSAPTTYIQQAPPEEPIPAASDWYYYCRKPEGYYPYVRQCPGGWQRIPTQPQQ